MGLVRRAVAPAEGAADTVAGLTLEGAGAGEGQPDRRHRRRDVPGLVAGLNAADPETRRRAAVDLADEPDGVPALVARVGVERDPAVRDTVLTQLARLDSPEVATGLVPHLGSDDAGLRNAVVVAMAQMPRSVPPLVPGLLADPDPDVRILTIMMMAGLRVAELEGWLVGVLEHDTHTNVVASAVSELVPIAGPEAVDVLEAVPARFPDDPFLAFTVRAALARLRGAA